MKVVEDNNRPAEAERGKREKKRGSFSRCEPYLHNTFETLMIIRSRSKPSQNTSITASGRIIASARRSRNIFRSRTADHDLAALFCPTNKIIILILIITMIIIIVINLVRRDPSGSACPAI